MNQDQSSAAPAHDDSVLDITLNDAPSGIDTPVQAAVHIRLDAAVRRQMLRYANSDTSRELGGILLGTVQDGMAPVMTVEAVIFARYTDAVQSSITFTHRTWQDIYEIKDRDYPDKKIVGWYHTHPSFGIFLSNYDLHIHKNFFMLPWQVAYVVDPLAGDDGFFRWEGGNIEKVSDYEIIGEEPSVAANFPQEQRRQQSISQRYHIIIIFILLIIILLSLIRLYLSVSANSFVRQAKTDLSAAQVPDKQHSALDQPRSTINTASPVYCVRSNDCLWNISCRYYGTVNAATGLEIIRTANHLTGDTIYAGMHLRIPGGLLLGNQHVQLNRSDRQGGETPVQ